MDIIEYLRLGSDRTYLKYHCLFSRSPPCFISSSRIVLYFFPLRPFFFSPPVPKAAALSFASRSPLA